MIELEEWLRASLHPCILKWRAQLNDLGASWDTFKRERSEVIHDLESGGIPRLAARDIFNIIEEEINRSQAPLVILWDLDLMQIPASANCTAVIAHLRSMLRRFGNLVLFRGYTNRPLSIPLMKRSELQLAGCTIVDTSHNGLAQDMGNNTIFSAVDAMKFALKRNIEQRVTICFVSSKIDAYLLANLRDPNIKTIVISDGPSQSMLHGKCDMMINWETEVLLLQPSIPPGFSSSMQTHIDVPQNPLTRNGIIQDRNGIFPARTMGLDFPEKVLTEALHDTVSLSKSDGSSERRIDDISEDEIKLLRTVVTSNAHVGHDGSGTLKCQVGSVLRSTYSNRFPDRASIQIFLNKAVDRNIIVESCDGGTKLLHLPEDIQNTGLPNIHLSVSLPIPYDAIPSRVKEVSLSLPIILFLQKCKVPQGSKFPDKTFVQSADKFMILMYRSVLDAQRAAASRPWILQNASTIVDWRKIGDSPTVRINTEPFVSDDTYKCHKCSGNFLNVESFVMPETLEQVCRSCFTSSNCWTADEKSRAIKKVVLMLKELAENDDVYVRSSLIRRLIVERWPNECASRGQAALWVEEAVKQGTAKEVKEKLTSTKKVKVVCLAQNFKWVLEIHPEVATPMEEQHVINLLWERGRPVSRKDIIESLRKRFPRMDCPLLRNRMFMNAAASSSFYVAKGPYDQYVGLTQADAASALDTGVVSGITGMRLDDAPENASVGKWQDNDLSSVGSETFNLERFLFTSSANTHQRSA